MTAVPAAGTRLRSAVCSTEVVVIRVSPAAGPISCGGVPMTLVTRETALPAGAPRPGFEGGTRLGKRYVGPDESVELLCTKPGAGSLSVGSHVLAVRSAKPLPASD
jgi:hypothetical protein